MCFIDPYDALLLDMNGTFMFGHDRFGPDQDYFATYKAVGGSRMDRDELLAVWDPSLTALLSIYQQPERFDDFPSLGEVFASHGAPPDELTVMERVFAAHEIGTVPAAHVRCIRRLARTRHLGVVSNLCSHPDIWLETCSSAAVFRYFKTLVFSSEGRSIKPSRLIFDRALAQLPREASVLFVGDSLERDIIPAKALGLATVWIAPAGSTHPAADRIVESLTDLSEIEA